MNITNIQKLFLNYIYWGTLFGVVGKRFLLAFYGNDFVIFRPKVKRYEF